MPILKTYQDITSCSNRTAYVIQYHSSSQDAIIDFLRECTSSDPSKAGGAYELIGYTDAKGVRDYIRPGSMVIVYTDTREVRHLYPEIFDLNFREYVPATSYIISTDTVKLPPAQKTKATPMPSTPNIPADNDDYDTNLSAVYDALAILRVNPREQDFEYAAKELMDLLAAAFNEGFNYGMVTAQHNPYEAAL